MTEGRSEFSVYQFFRDDTTECVFSFVPAALQMWTVYDHPKDYPDRYVARRFDVDGNGVRPTETFIACPDLDQIRRFLAEDMRLTPLRRNDEDDPVIIETWV